MHDAVLVADDVRARLSAAVAPMLAAVLEQLDPEVRALAEGRLTLTAGGTTYTGRVGALIQAHPALLRIVLLGLPRSVELERLDGDQVPGLAAVVEEAMAGALAGLSPRTAEAAIAAAATKAGGFVLLFDPEPGHLAVMLATAGEDLSRSLVVGGIGDAPGTAH